MNIVYPVPRMTLQWRLKVLMAIRDISAKKLSLESGLSYSTVVKLRNTMPSRFDADTLEKLCSTLNCQPGDLLQWAPDNDAA